MAAPAALLHPPKAILTFRVGIVGHRPNRLAKDLGPLRVAVRRVLESVRTSVAEFRAAHPGVYADGEPVLRVVSPLAEGSDRIVADEAMGLGFGLQCPMPFPQEEYEKDFVPPHALSPGSLQEFRALLARGEQRPGFVRFEADGDRKDAGHAYGAIGRIVLNHSDILIVVWDGKPAAGRGGTADKVREAVLYEIPVVWIDPLDPSAWSVLRKEKDLPAASEPVRATPAATVRGIEDIVRELVAEVLAPPDPPPPDPERPAPKPDLREAFFEERRPRCNLAFLWKFFRNLVGDAKTRIQGIRVEEYEKDLGAQWRSAGSSIADWANAGLRRHYAWSDKVADHYGDRYRSAFVYGFLAAVVAVSLALIPLVGLNAAAGSRGGAILAALCTAAELLVIVSIVVVVTWSGRRRWHERWLEYRLVAELVRQLRVLLPLGGGRPFPRVPAYAAGFGHPARTWMYWHARAIEREIGLPNARVDAGFLRDAVDYARSVVKEQVDFHRTTKGRSRRIAERLHRAGSVAFWLTLGACALHFLPHAEIVGLRAVLLPEWLPERLLAVLCGALPALGAALVAINYHGEFERISKRSHGMADRLGALLEEIEALVQRGDSLRLDEVVAPAAQAVEVMVGEVLDWRVVFADRRVVYV